MSGPGHRPAEQDELLTTTEARKVLRVGKSKLFELLKTPPEKGGLESVLAGGPQMRRIPRSSINAYIEWLKEHPCLKQDPRST